MEYESYIAHVRERFQGRAEVANIGETTFAYEEVFKWRWIATKLKISTFVTCAERVGRDDMAAYDEKWFKYALEHRRGLPRGLQNGLVVFNVLASHDVQEGARAFVRERPKKYYSAFVYPILADLANDRLCYYEGDIIWGKMYVRFMQNYIKTHLSFPSVG